MEIIEASEAYLGQLVPLGQVLWPSESSKSLETTFKETFFRPNEITFCLKNGEQIVALAIFSMRSEYVEGAQSSPTGYLEAVVVDPDQRGQGFAEKLVEQGIAWCKARGCHQLASDVEWGNEASQAFHHKVGFREVNRLVCYIRDI